jgi:glycosyltransferase involved in cell wall biosynthesis
VFHKENVGLARTLNEGLEVAQSELVARMDQDDEALPNRLSTQLRFMQARPEVVVVGSFVYHMGRTAAYDRLIRLPEEHDEIAAALTKSNCLYHPSVIMRRKPVLALGGYRAEYKNAEDYDLWLRVAKVHLLANIPVPLLRYRFSISGMTLGKKWQQAHYWQMAIASHLHPDWSHEQIREEASKALEQLGKDYFLEQVAKGTIQELVRLGLGWDAMRVLWLFSRQLSRRKTFGLVRDFGLALSAAWRHRP